MLDNLEGAPNTAFGDRVSTSQPSDKMLSIRIGPSELTVNDCGELCGVSGLGAKCLDVGVDNLSRSVTATGATVETKV